MTTNLTALKSAFVSMLFIITLALLLCHAAMAEPLPQKNSPPQTAPTKPAASYRLMLSLGKNWNISQAGLPVVATFANLGPDTLVYNYTRNPFSFQVEYRTARADAVIGTSWVTLVPFPPPYVGRPIKILAMDDTETLFVGQHWSKQTYTPEFSTTAEGFYRIMARMDFPEAFQFTGPTDNPRNYRKIIISLYSNSVVVRRTKTALIVVDAATSKKTDSK